MCYAFILAKENLMAQGWETWKPSGCVENHYALHFCSWSIKMCLSFKSLHLFRFHQWHQVSWDFLLPDFLCVPMSNEELRLTYCCIYVAIYGEEYYLRAHKKLPWIDCRKHSTGTISADRARTYHLTGWAGGAMISLWTRSGWECVPVTHP